VAVEQIGTLKRLRRYPVKSMAGEDLAEARVTFAGITGDRVCAFIDAGNRSNFPWMTARQAHEMILFRPRFLDPPRPDDDIPCALRYTAEVTSPEGQTFRVDDAAFAQHLEKRFGRSLRFRFSERSMTDARPISILGLSTLRALSTETEIELDPRRFRENFYVEWKDPRPFFEDELVGRELQIGDTSFVQVVKKNGRCIIITLDPETAVSSPNIFRQVSQHHEGCIGVYGAVLREGIIRVNDPIYAV